MATLSGSCSTWRSRQFSAGPRTCYHIHRDWVNNELTRWMLRNMECHNQLPKCLVYIVVFLLPVEHAIDSIVQVQSSYTFHQGLKGPMDVHVYIYVYVTAHVHCISDLWPLTWFKMGWPCWQRADQFQNWPYAHGSVQGDSNDCVSNIHVDQNCNVCVGSGLAVDYTTILSQLTDMMTAPRLDNWHNYRQCRWYNTDQAN